MTVYVAWCRVWWLVSACVLLFGRGVAAGHSFAPALLDLREHDPGVFDVAWKTVLSDAESLSGDTEFVPLFPTRCQRVSGTADFFSAGEEPAFWRIDCGTAGLGGERISVRGIEGSRLDVIVRILWRGGVVSTGVLRSGHGVFIVPDIAGSKPAEGMSALTVLASYVSLGIEHILGGFDHLLFVFGLLLLVRGWRMLLKTISAFTAAHSLTLSAAVLGVVEIPTPPVEAMIAFSIVLLAVELTRPAEACDTLAHRRPWLVALTFGLLHGFGFAGALTNVGLPADQIPLALFGFNVGVEIGQIFFVGFVWVPLAWLTRRPGWPRVHWVPSYAIGAVAVALALDRIVRMGGW